MLTQQEGLENQPREIFSEFKPPNQNLEKSVSVDTFDQALDDCSEPDFKDL